MGNPMGRLRVERDDVSIEDHFGSLKVDFANKMIGGGALSGGSLQ